MTSKQSKSPFQRVVDELTDGCGCACHTGTGYRTSCEHCTVHWDKHGQMHRGPVPTPGTYQESAAE